MMRVTIINHSNLSADLSRTQIKEEIDEFNDENLIKINPKANISDQMPYWNRENRSRSSQYRKYGLSNKIANFHCEKA
jgi:hypothetical protein